MTTCIHCGQVVLPIKTLTWEEVPGQPHVRRAIEVACAGGHPIALLVPAGLEPEATALLAWAQEHSAQGVAVTPCPCGYFGDPDHECYCDVVIVAQHRKSAAWQSARNADIFIQLVRPTAREILNPRSEPAARIEARILAARVQSHELTTATLDETTQQLLGAAMRLQMMWSQVQTLTVLRLASTIWSLAGTERFHVAYLAEALQYLFREP